jgi:GTP pyrophosphokinase
MEDTLLQSLIESFDSYIKRESDRKLIEKAYFLSKEKHEGQMRKSGEPYITHPVAVAKIIADLRGGPATIIAALLHDTVEDTSLTLKEVETDFGIDIALLVDGVTKIGKLSFTTKASQADNHQKMLLAMAKDIRVVLIKIADRLHNVRTLESMSPEKQYKIASETLEIYAPLAHRLGIFKIKAELEDRSLRYTDPPMYYRVSNMIQTKKNEREKSIDRVIENIKVLFADSSLHDFEIKGRIKNIFSIYKKMVKDNRAFEDIYDLLAVRIIVDKIENCYQALGIIHANFTPIPRRFKDYIAVPKPNMYQ